MSHVRSILSAGRLLGRRAAAARAAGPLTGHATAGAAHELEPRSGSPAFWKAEPFAASAGNTVTVGPNGDLDGLRLTRSQSPAMLSPEEIEQAIPATLMSLMAYFTSSGLHMTVRLGIPDAIGSEVLTVSEICNRIGSPDVRPDIVHRVLRFLSAVGIYHEHKGPDGEAAYSLGLQAKICQTGLPQPSLACASIYYTEKPLWDAFGRLPAYAAGVDASFPFNEVNGMSIWDFYGQNPKSSAAFSEFMSVFSVPEVGICTSMVDWTRFKTVMDVGGSRGPVMAAVKAQNPAVQCINFDLPEVIKMAEAEPPEGVELVAGSFFEAATIPPADCVLMKHILHDWSDEESKQILDNLHQALPPHGRLILGEAVIPDPAEETPVHVPAKFLDVLMSMYGGKERSRAEWVRLLEGSGWVLESITETPGPNCQLIEARKA